MNAIEKIIEKASALNGTVVLPEGMDARVITAACACVDRKICTPVVLGTVEEIAAAEAKAGLSLAERGIKVIDHHDATLLWNICGGFRVLAQRLEKR